MKKKTIIWKKSVEDNDYVCKCGNVLLQSGKMIGVIKPKSGLYEQGILCCNNCHHVVAKELI